MIDRIVDEVLKGLDRYSEDYANSLYNRVSMFLDYTQLPCCFMERPIDISQVTSRVKNLYDNATTLIEDRRTNTIVNLGTYEEAGFISAMMMERYVKDCLSKDNHIVSVLYIDTNLLIEDYKKLMDYKEGKLSPSTIHSMEVLYKEITEADFVFWDRFAMVNSAFAYSKLYEILTIRYRRCLGNMFFITGGLNTFTHSKDAEFMSVMKAKRIYELQQEKIKHKEEN